MTPPHPLQAGRPGILERMKLTYDIYRLTKLTKTICKEVSKDDPDEFKQTSRRTSPTIKLIAKRYAYKYGVDYNDAYDLVTDACRRQYLEAKGPDGAELIKLDYKGRRILDKIPFLPFIPKGLLETWWSEDNATVRLLLVLLFGSFGLAITHVVISVYQVVVSWIT